MPPSPAAAARSVVVLLLGLATSTEGLIVHEKESQVTLQVAIETAPKHFANRQVVRSTWMRHPEVLAGHVNVKFFAGVSNSSEVMENLTAERKRYGDIVLLDVEDSYAELRLKTLAVLHWFGKSPTADFLLKTDDDTYRRLSRIMQKLQELAAEKYCYLGYFHQKVPLVAPINPKREPWKRPNRTTYPRMVYPTFASGQGYILSKALAVEIGYNRHESALRNLVFPHEDISVGYWTQLFEGRVPSYDEAAAYDLQVRELRARIAALGRREEEEPEPEGGAAAAAASAPEEPPAAELRARLREIQRKRREAGQGRHKRAVRRVKLPTTQLGCRETDFFSGNREPEEPATAAAAAAAAAAPPTMVAGPGLHVGEGAAEQDGALLRVYQKRRNCRRHY